MLQSLPSFDLHIPMTTTNHSLFFLLFAPMLLQLHARESQFFSKFSNHSPIEDELLPTTTTQSQQQDQNFIPQTTDSTGYGLYGHLPPSTTSLSVANGGDHDNHPTIFPENYNTVAYTTPVQSKDSFDTTTDPQYANKNQFNGDNNMYMSHNKQDKFYNRLPPLTTTPATNNGGANDNLPTTFPEKYNTVAYTTPIHSENFYETTATEYGNKDQYNGDNNMYNYQKQGASDTWVLDYGKHKHVNDMYNTEKQGMSDTRYMKNGKYYYDLNSRSSNPRVFGRSSNSRVFDSRDGYNTRGYYGNDDNSYNRYNSNARFQEDQEDVFTP